MGRQTWQKSHNELALTLLPIRITFVLGRKRPRLWRRPEEHLRDLHPVLAVGAREERLCIRIRASVAVSAAKGRGRRRTEFVAALECRGTLIDPRGEALEDADGDVAVLEGERFAEVAPRLVHADRVRSEMS